jgi:hypothetical protein
MINILACPTAEGYGRYTTGGRYLEVYFVTNNDDTGAGSLRTAYTSGGGKIIIPRVSGNINLGSRIFVGADRSNITFLGMLAPGDGICLARGGIRYGGSNNHIIRHMRIRRGDDGAGNSLISQDSLDVTNGSSDYFVGNSSFSWGNDENATMYQGSNITMQDCMVAEAINTAEGDTTNHAFTSIFGGNGASMVRCLLTSGIIRNPSISTDSRADLINNVMYNWEFRATNDGVNSQSNLYHNYYKPGPATLERGGNTVENFLFPTGNGLEGTYGKFYLEGNKLQGHSTTPSSLQTRWTNVTNDNWVGVRLQDTERQNLYLEDCKNKDSNGNLVPHPIPAGMYKPFMTSDEAFTYVLANAGNSLKRDAFDARIVNEVQNGTVFGVGSLTGLQGIPDFPSDSGGYPTLSSTPVILTGDAPHYLPSDFITKYSLNPALDYISAGDPSTAPWRFIFFEDGVAVNYQTLPLGYDWQNTTHYNVYEVLSFEVTGEIDLLVGENPVNTFTLSLTSTSGGTVSSTPTAGTITAGTSITLSATPESGFLFSAWRLNTASGSVVSTNPNYSFNMPSSDYTLVGVFVSDTPIPPGNRKGLFKKRNT